MENSLPSTPDLSSAPSGGMPAVPPQQLYNPGWIPVGLVCISLGIITGFAEVFSDSVALSFLSMLGVFLSLFLTFLRLERRYPVQRLRVYFLVQMILYGVMCLFSGADKVEDFIIGLLLCAAYVFFILTGVELRKAARIMPAEFGFGKAAGTLLIVFSSVAVFFALIASAAEEDGTDATALWFLTTLILTGCDVVLIILMTQVNRLFDRRPAIVYPPYSPTQPAAAPINPSVVPAPQDRSNSQWITFGKICGIITICFGVGNWLVGKFTDNFSLPIYFTYTGVFAALYVIFSRIQTRYPVRRLSQYFLVLLILAGVLGLSELFEYVAPSPNSNTEFESYEELVSVVGESEGLRELWEEASESSSDWSSIIKGFSMFLLFPMAILSILCGTEYSKLAKLYPKEKDFGYGKTLGISLVIANSVSLVCLLLGMIVPDQFDIIIGVLIAFCNGDTWYAYVKPLMELKYSVFLKQEC